MGGVVPFFMAIPVQKVGDVVMVKGIGMMEWTDIAGTGEFHGYRSLRCGSIEFGTTSAPRTYEADLVGGLSSKKSQASIWAWAQQNGHAVSASNWTPKVFRFADVDANTFRFPDLRDVFPRFMGSNVDSGAARSLGSYQADAFKSHRHTGGEAGFIADRAGKGQYAPTGDGNNWSPGWQMTYEGGSETRPMNTAFAPRIHL
ncbi:hypothetical protein RC52_05355 [Herbaspirillum rubrisubalbicans]|nr:hypothetical protein [Herbaspirillum rubrisubalbicans]